jgi:hypothetical protein
MYDSLLNLHSANISGAATTNGTPKFLGRNRTFRVWGRVAGDVTGGTPTLTISLEEGISTTGPWTAIPGSMILTEQVGYVATTTPRYEVPSAVAVLPNFTFTTTKDYVRTSVVAGGTTPAFPGMTVATEPIDAPILASGR